MAGLAAATARPAAAAQPQTGQAGPCTPDAGSAATPEQPQHQQQQQQPQTSCAPSQVESCLAALPIMRNEIYDTVELDEHASKCSAIRSVPVPFSVKHAGHNGCGAHQTQLHSLSSAMEMDADPEAQNSRAEEHSAGTAEQEALGNSQLTGQVQGETGGLAVGNGPSGAEEAPGLCKGSAVASEDASSASKGLVQKADGDNIPPVPAGCFNEGVHPVGVTTYTEASALASTAERAGICVFLHHSCHCDDATLGRHFDEVCP